jgi:hypothetical protein
MRIYESRVHSHTITGLADASFNLIAHSKTTGDLSGGCGSALVWENGIP